MVTTYPNVELCQGTISGTGSLSAARPVSQEVRPAREVGRVAEAKSGKPESSFFSALLKSLAAFAV